jgi:hypothetical protein
VRSLTLSAVLVAVVSGLVLAGCGGSSSDTKANDAYADNVCTAVGTWEQSIKDIATDFSGGISKASLQKKIDQAKSATDKLVSDVKAVPPPDTDEGNAAKQQLDQLSSDVKTTVKAAQSALGQIQDDASLATITAAVAALGPQVQSLVGEAKSAIGTLKDAGGSLADAFKSTDSCKSLNPT